MQSKWVVHLMKNMQQPMICVLNIRFTVHFNLDLLKGTFRRFLILKQHNIIGNFVSNTENLCMNNWYTEYWYRLKLKYNIDGSFGSKQTPKALTNKYSESCSSLPPDIQYLKTEVIFPVNYGTGVTVSCSDDKELRGDEVITCNQGTEFLYQDKPKCNDFGM